MSRRGENIHKRKDGRWEGRVLTEMSDGVKKYISVYGHTYAEAKQKIKDKRRQPCLSSVSNSKFESVAMQWLFSLKASIKGATETKYYFLLKNHILPFFSQFYLNDITKSDLLIFMNEKLSSGKKDGSGGLSVTYVKEIMTVIFLILQYAFDQDILAVAPPKIKLPQIPKTEIKVFTINEQKKYETVLNRSTNLFNLGILIAFYSGLRLGELCALKWENVDMKEKIIHVRSTVSRVKSKESDETVLIIDSPKTQCSLRDIPMSKYLFSLFENALAISGKDYVLSKSTDFLSPRTFEYNYKKTLKESNLPQYNFHSIRHTFATRCIENGVDAKTLSELLGHSNVSITLNTYVHSSLELKRSQLNKISL